MIMNKLTKVILEETGNVRVLISLMSSMQDTNIFMITKQIFKIVRLVPVKHLGK